MTDQQEPEKQPEPKKKAGSIRQYATLGRGTGTPQRSDVQTSSSPSTQEPEHRDAETLERSGGEASRNQNTETLEQTGTKTPKRERHTIYLPPELSEWVKIRAIKTKSEISELVTEAVERYKSAVEE